MKYLCNLLLLCFSLTAAAQSSHSDSIALSEKLYAEGVDLYRAKDYKKAAKTFERLRPIDEQLYDSLHHFYGYAKGWLARCYHMLGRTKEAIPLSPMFEMDPSDRRPRILVDSLGGIATKRFLEGDLDGALALYPEIERMEIALGGEQSPDYAATLTFHGYVLLYKGDPEGALPYCRKGADIMAAIAGTDSYAWTYAEQPTLMVLPELGRYEETAELSKKMLALYDKFGDHSSTDYLSTLYAYVVAMASGASNDPDEVLRAAQLLKQRCEESNHTSHYLYAVAIGTMGEMYFYKVNLPLATDCLQRAEELFRGYDNADFSWQVRFLSFLAQIKATEGDYTTAKALAERGMDLCKGPMSESYLYNQLLMVKGASALALNDKYRGLMWIDQSIERYRKSGQVDKVYVDGLMAMSNYYRTVNNHQKDLEYSRLMVDAYQEMPNAGDSLVLTSMMNLTGSLVAYSEMDSAKVMLARTVAKAETITPHNSTYGSVMQWAAQMAINLALFNQGADYARRSIETFSGIGDEQNMYFSLSVLAMAQYSNNDFVEAAESQRKVVDYAKRKYGEESQDYTNAAQGLAMIEMALGNVQQGQQLFSDAHYASDYHQKEENYNANERLQLGQQLLTMGQTDLAKVVYKQAMELLRQDSLQRTASYASALFGLAQAEARRNEYQPSLMHAEEGIAIMESIFGREKALMNSTPLYVLQGELLLNAGRTSEGFAQMQEVERVISKYVDDENMVCLQAGWNVCNAAIMDNRPEVAVDYAERLSARLREFILSKFTTMSAAERMGIWNQNEVFFNGVLPYLADRYRNNGPLAGRMADCAYDGQLLSKGLLLTTEIEMNRLLMESGDERATQTFAELKRQRTLLDQQVALPIEQRSMDVDSLRQVVNRLERQLTAMSTTYGDYTRPLRTTWQQVRDKLEKTDVAVEFVNFFPQREDSLQIPALGALVLKRGMEHPVMVGLCDDWQVRVISRDGCYASDSLSLLIWKPLEEYLKDARRVFFSAAGALHDLAVEYVPYDGSKTFSECFDTYRLSSTREVVTASKSKPLQSARLFGGLQYNAKMEDVSAANQVAGLTTDVPLMASRAVVDSLLLRGGAGYLAYTLKEVEEIEHQLNGKVGDVRTLVGVQGSEEAFKNLSGHAADILHVATHGFFWTEEDIKRVGNLAFLQTAGGTATTEEDKALSRSGLLFAGANAALMRKSIPDNMEDGILTARELAQMDLRGTSLVVLSACQTALGTVTGEGVFGLQRGFKKAGAKTIVMSLWKVDDQATQILMTAFYRHLAEGQSSRKAFAEAQRHLRQVENGRFDQPIYWAAFILLDAMEK